jgi:hypothetical protein
MNQQVKSVSQRKSPSGIRREISKSESGLAGFSMSQKKNPDKKGPLEVDEFCKIKPSAENKIETSLDLGAINPDILSKVDSTGSPLEQEKKKLSSL